MKTFFLCLLLCTAAYAVELKPIPEQWLLPRAPAAVEIDGDVGEWDLAGTDIVADPTSSPADQVRPNNPMNPLTSAADLSGRATLAWDDTYLYIAGTTTDDDLRGIKVVDKHNVGPAGWACDSMMFQLHSFRQPLKTNTPYAPSPFVCLRYEVREGGRGHLVDNSRGVLDRGDAYWKLPDGSRFASRETADGYAVEAAIPWAGLEFVPQPGEILYVSMLIADIDEDEALTQLGWRFPWDRYRTVFRLDAGRGALGVLTLPTPTAIAGEPWLVRYAVDALEQTVQLQRLTITPADGDPLVVALEGEIPAGQRGSDVVEIAAMPAAVGPATVQLEAQVGGQAVVVAREVLAITEPVAPPPLIVNPPGEIAHMRPDRVAHNAQEDARRGIYQYHYIDGRGGYERYLMTHVRDYVEKHTPGTLQRGDGRHGSSEALMCWALFQLTGDEKYAGWTRDLIRLIMDTATKTAGEPGLGVLRSLVRLRWHVWQHNPDSPWAPEGIEAEWRQAWADAASDLPDWQFSEWGYHNRTWHRWFYAKACRLYAQELDKPYDPRIDEYIAWHEERMVALGDTTDNSPGYNWVFMRYPMAWHMMTDSFDAFLANAGYMDAVRRYREYVSPSGAMTNWGNTSGWMTGASSNLQNFELLAALSGEGEFRYQAHRIAEYFYNHFWPAHDQYHGPRDRVAVSFAIAWLEADDTIRPKPVAPTSTITWKYDTVPVPPHLEGTKPGFRYGMLTGEQVPCKLILRSGGRADDMWAMVELLDMGGHSGVLPGAILGLLKDDSALITGQGYYESSQDYQNVVWVEDLEGVVSDPRGPQTSVAVLADDPLVTYVRLVTDNYGHLPITCTRDIAFVKDAFIVVRDRLDFHAAMKLRVGPCWNTRNLGPQCGEDWFNSYYEQLYHTGLGLGRGVHAYENPAWDLLIAYAPRSEYAISVLDRWDDNPYRMSPIRLRQYWAGIARAGDTRVFTSILLPHAPAFDPAPFRETLEFLVEDDDRLVVRAPTLDNWRKPLTGDLFTVQINDSNAAVTAPGWSSDAPFAVVRQRANGQVHSAAALGGETLRFEDTDLLPSARKLSARPLAPPADQ